ncbi:hypothetical protein ACLB2K_026728 [Fragaria x ananassa]
MLSMSLLECMGNTVEQNVPANCLIKCVRSYVSWNTLVSSYALNYDCDGACEIYNRMELDGLEPNPVTWTSLLSSHARCGRNEKTMELFDMMRVRGTDATAEVLVVVYS